MTPLVSVVIPTYNRSALLQETLASIRSQTFQDFDIIIVDNLSTDGTEAAVAALGEPRITYLRHANHGVIAVNRNVGIRRAMGKFVAFCDDDDLWMPDKLERQVAVMQSDPAVGLCYTDGSTFRDDDIVHPRMISRRVHTDHFAKLLWDNFVPSSSVMVRRALFADLGLIDESPELLAVEDYELWIRFAHRAKLVFLDEPPIRYRFHRRTAGLAPGAVSLRNIRVLRSVRRKLHLPAWLIGPAIARQYAKHLWFRLAGR
jgi:glycosyltransferase involved in cell wall biosynthesis